MPTRANPMGRRRAASARSCQAAGCSRSFSPSRMSMPSSAFRPAHPLVYGCGLSASKHVPCRTRDRRNPPRTRTTSEGRRDAGPTPGWVSEGPRDAGPTDADAVCGEENSVFGCSGAGRRASAHGTLTLEALGGAELGAARARVGGELRRARDGGVAGEDAQPRPAPADAGGQLWRADAAALLGLEEALDDAILQGVEADDDEAPAGPEQLHRRGERHLEAAELVVDGDAQRLEGARGGVDAAGPAADDGLDQP